jgi:hypothetical protein
MLNIIILANRQMPEDNNSFNDYPSYLSQQNGESVLEKLIQACTKLEEANITFAAFEKDILKFNLRQVLKRLAPGIRIAVTPNLTMGSGCTALLTACAEAQDAELLILSANEVIEIDLQEVLTRFREMNFDAGTVVFKSIHPRYSYVKLENQVRISEFAQKEQLSEFATTGLFWYRETQECVDSLKSMIQNRTPISGSYYVGMGLNETILKGKLVGSFHLSERLYFPLKDAAQVAKYELGAGNGKV